MFFMSSCDLMTSLAITFTTLPMPCDVIYDFGTASYGNTFTCSLQGFAVYVGSVLGIFSICILCVYYLCVIKFQLDSEKIEKYVEPTLYCLSMILALFPGITFWKAGLLNPQPYEPYCTVGSYPLGCRIYQDPQGCIRGGDSDIRGIDAILVPYFLFSVIVLGVLTVVISMATIVVSIRRIEMVVPTSGRLTNDNKTSNVLTIQQRPQVQSSEISRNCGGSFCPSEGKKDLDTEMTTHSTPELERKQSIRRKKIAIQACMYIAAFLLTWVFTVLAFCFRSSNVIAALKMIFQPLQGFFNAIIFVYHKVDNVKQLFPNISFWEAAWFALAHPNGVPEDVVISRLELILLENNVHRPLRRFVGIHTSSPQEELSHQPSSPSKCINSVDNMLLDECSLSLSSNHDFSALETSIQEKPHRAAATSESNTTS
jgi:hypothetical protein